MDFRLTDEQRMVRESARTLLQRECEPAHVKEVEKRAPFYDERLWRHSGELGWLDLAADSDSTLVAAHAGDGVALFAVDAAAEGIARNPLDAGPGVPLATVTLEGVRAGAADMVAGPGDGAEAIRQLVIDAGVLGSALMLGHASAACDVSVAYAKTREQFGVLIGTFQAVQHRLADAATDVETLRVLVNAAAWKRARNEPDAELAAAIAKAWGAEVLERVVSAAHQVHAGIGYTDE